MAFINIPGLEGKVYIPEKQENMPKKHQCKDCYFCQFCSDDRCRVCLAPKNCECRKLSEK